MYLVGYTTYSTRKHSSGGTKARAVRIGRRRRRRRWPGSLFRRFFGSWGEEFHALFLGSRRFVVIIPLPSGHLPNYTRKRRFLRL